MGSSYYSRQYNIIDREGLTKVVGVCASTALYHTLDNIQYCDPELIMTFYEENYTGNGSDYDDIDSNDEETKELNLIFYLYKNVSQTFYTKTGTKLELCYYNPDAEDSCGGPRKGFFFSVELYTGKHPKILGIEETYKISISVTESIHRVS